MHLKNKQDRIVLSFFIVLTIFVVALLGVFSHYETKYNILRDNYDFLEEKYANANNTNSDAYEKLEIDYSNLTEKYNTLFSKYSNINKDYNSYKNLIQQYNSLLIDHLISLSFNEIRKENQPNYDPWVDDPYYYEQISVEYAANICAHDLGRVYWPNIENIYYNLTGLDLCDEAYNRIFQAIELADISNSDTDTQKVEKILSFMSSFIEYQYDLNDEFLFPSETLSFKTGDCDDFSILAAALFEYEDIQSAIGFFESDYYEYAHCMVLIKLNDLEGYKYYFYDDLTAYGLSNGRWIILEPQSKISDQSERSWFEKWDIYAIAEIPE
jgi:hypothetical protein